MLSEDDIPFVMVTYNPDSSMQTFTECREHGVYTNDSRKVSNLPPPRYPTSPPTFKHKEQGTVQLPDFKTMKVSELVQKLTEPIKPSDDNGGNTDADIVRRLFYWLISQRLQDTDYGMSSSFLRVNYQLQRLSEKRNTYAAFFSLLCHHAGIPCVIIHGHVKGSRYDIGDKVTDSLLREWNAVLIDGHWQLVDTFWGSQELTGYSRDTWYLFPKPKQLIYSHLPASAKWQLLKKPITKETFEKQAFLKPRFFNMRLRLFPNSTKEYEVTVPKGESEMQFLIDPDKEVNQEFKCIISRQMGDVWKEVPLPKKNISLDFVSKVSTAKDISDDFDEPEEEEVEEYNQIDVTYDALSVKVRYPEMGKYKLEILGSDTKAPISTQPRTQRLNQKPEGPQYDWVAIYKLNVTWVPDWVVYFPKMPVRGWGRNPYLTKCGLRLHMPVSGVFTCPPGPLELKFKILPTAPTRNVKLCCIVKENRAEPGDTEASNTQPGEDEVSNPETKKDYDSSVIEDNIITVTLNMEVGEKKVTLFAKLNKDEKGEVCNYLITCKEPVNTFTVEEVTRMTKKLREVMDGNQFEPLRFVLLEAKKSGIFAHVDVRTIYRLAFDKLKRMQKHFKLLKYIQKIDNQVILNLRKYNQPPEIIVTILKATFLLLENKEYTWEHIRRKLTTLGQDSLTHSLEKFDSKTLKRGTIEAVKKLTNGIQATDMIERVQDIAPILRWVEVMIEQCSEAKRGTTKVKQIEVQGIGGSQTEESAV